MKSNMVQNPLLSIRLMTYNHASYIEDALEGISIQQTDFDFEVVIGDDFSTDDTLKILQNPTFKNSRFTLRILKRNKGDTYHEKRMIKGRLYNFISTIRNCRGKYIALLDGDDYWTDPLKLQKQVDFLEQHEDYFVCFHPCYFLKPGVNGNRIEKQKIDDIDYNYSLFNLLSKWGISTASIVIRNNINFPKWFTEVASGDIALVMSHYNKGKFKMLEDYMSVYRITGNGVSQSHQSYAMIHYRAKLYGFLNEHFNYKYEKEIYSALLNIYAQYDLIPFEHFANRKRIIRRLKKFLKLKYN